MKNILLILLVIISYLKSLNSNLAIAAQKDPECSDLIPEARRSLHNPDNLPSINMDEKIIDEVPGILAMLLRDQAPSPSGDAELEIDMAWNYFESFRPNNTFSQAAMFDKPEDVKAAYERLRGLDQAIKPNIANNPYGIILNQSGNIANTYTVSSSSNAAMEHTSIAIGNLSFEDKLDRLMKVFTLTDYFLFHLGAYEADFSTNNISYTYNPYNPKIGAHFISIALNIARAGEIVNHLKDVIHPEIVRVFKKFRHYLVHQQIKNIDMKDMIEKLLRIQFLISNNDNKIFILNIPENVKNLTKLVDNASEFSAWTFDNLLFFNKKMASSFYPTTYSFDEELDKITKELGKLLKQDQVSKDLSDLLVARSEKFAEQYKTVEVDTPVQSSTSNDDFYIDDQVILKMLWDISAYGLPIDSLINKLVDSGSILPLESDLTESLLDNIPDTNLKVLSQHLLQNNTSADVLMNTIVSKKDMEVFIPLISQHFELTRDLAYLFNFNGQSAAVTLSTFQDLYFFILFKLSEIASLIRSESYKLKQSGKSSIWADYFMNTFYSEVRKGTRNDIAHLGSLSEDIEGIVYQKVLFDFFKSMNGFKQQLKNLQILLENLNLDNHEINMQLDAINRTEAHFISNISISYSKTWTLAAYTIEKGLMPSIVVFPFEEIIFTEVLAHDPTKFRYTSIANDPKARVYSSILQNHVKVQLQTQLYRELYSDLVTKTNIEARHLATDFFDYTYNLFQDPNWSLGLFKGFYFNAKTSLNNLEFTEGVLKDLFEENREKIHGLIYTSLRMHKQIFERNLSPPARNIHGQLEIPK